MHRGGMKRALSYIAILTLGGLPALVLLNLGLSAVPRNMCAWGDKDFCSDYGSFYLVFSGVFGLASIAALWAIHRRHRF